MAALSREIILAITGEFGPRELLVRISDPYWFQALGCVLGFDWHLSGLTTTVTGAQQDGLRGLEGELGVFLAGGKGAASRKTPAQIRELSGLSGVDPAARPVLRYLIVKPASPSGAETWNPARYPSI